MGKIIGIDLGTTNSVVSIMEGKESKVIPLPDGNRLLPSIVAFTDKGERLVGWMAKRQAVTNPQNTVYSIKRFMGRRRNEIAKEEEMVPYKITGSPGDLVKVDIKGKTYSPPEISAMVLTTLKEAAEAYLGQPVTEAVITVPAYFNDSQRQATKEAGKIAGLDVKRIINEPTAAALSYGMDKKKNAKIAVYDLGGGTFDISLLEVGENVVEVLSTNGNTHLGGDDFDQRLMNYVADEFKKKEGIDLRRDQMALQRLKEACEKAKSELSAQVQTEVNLPFITADASGPRHLQMTITRAKLESLIEDLVNSTLEPVKQALNDAKLKPEDINEVVLVGGSIRIPMVQKLLKDYFKREPGKGVNPDEVVSMGAAIQGAVLSGDVKDILLLDVTPLSLGLETLGSVFTRLIERNTTIPTSKKEIFSTAADSQTEVEIHVLQGEREMASGNRTLGRFRLAGIPAAPRGVPQIEVAFDIDANGILNVKAKDTATNKEQSIVIQASSGLDDKDVDRMMKDAEKYRDEDKKRRALAEARNGAEQVIHTTEKTIKDMGDKISKDELAKINSALENLKKVKDKEDPEVIKKAVEEVTKASHTVAQKAYEEAAKARGAQAGSGAPPGGAGPQPGAGPQQPPPPPGGQQAKGKGPGGDDKVIDAEFETK